jgi:DNA-binding HxlR family transcriptional regulator
MHDGTADSGVEPEGAGSRALSIFARVLNASLLRVHAGGPLCSDELEEKLGWAPKASLRLATANLCDLGALSQVEPIEVTQGSATELTLAGHGLLSVADALERWLSHSPFGSISLPDTAARGAVRALTAGWDSTIVTALAERPLTLAELDAEIPDHSYSKLKRRLAKLRSANLVTPVGGNGKSASYVASDWLRGAIAPLLVGGRWEWSHVAAETEPLSRREIEAALLLALPLVELPRDACGAGVLAALVSTEAGNGTKPKLAAVSFAVKDGRVVSCGAGAPASPTTWALGTEDAWLDALIDVRLDTLRVRGVKQGLALDVVRGLHDALFGA